MRVYSKDIIYSQFDPPEDLYFILKGNIKLMFDIYDGTKKKPRNVVFTVYIEGQYFGDSELFTNAGKYGRDGSAVADNESHLLVIEKKILFIVLKDFPEIKEDMKTVAKERRLHHLEAKAF
mmetsp:Transcript_19541/g.18657  ORF Transcript_19541/g.18657 Transcript_19541/m.18657 type:complete len:121 (+) Transcript_19541:355-717(+)